MNLKFEIGFYNFLDVQMEGVQPLRVLKGVYEKYFCWSDSLETWFTYSVIQIRKYQSLLVPIFILERVVK